MVDGLVMGWCWIDDEAAMDGWCTPLDEKKVRWRTRGFSI